jgi:hypothetical protein
MTIVPQAIATFGSTTIWAQLLTDKTDITNGEWMAVLGWHPLTIQIEGITTATVQIRGSNQKAQPANSADQFQLGVNITVDGLFALEVPVKWIKVNVSSYTSGTINAYLMATPKG